jgi:hypothetical protein
MSSIRRSGFDSTDDGQANDGSSDRTASTISQKAVQTAVDPALEQVSESVSAPESDCAVTAILVPGAGSVFPR